MIKAKIVAGSLNPFNDKKLVTFHIRIPRIILPEINTHKMLVSNAASSRAISFNKKVEAVSNDPFVPIAWQKDHKGMQGTKYFEGGIVEHHKSLWVKAKDNAVQLANTMANDVLYPDRNLTKQLCNRLLEPFEYIDVVISGTEWEHFFSLRAPQYNIGDGSIHRSKKDALKYIQSKGIDTSVGEMFAVSELDWIKCSESQAEIHIQAVAELMWDLYSEYDFKMLEPGEWHIPFIDTIQDSDICLLHYGKITATTNVDALYNYSKVKVATAICARGSYGKFEGKSVEDDLKLHDRLLSEKHMSPFSHSAKCPTWDEYYKYSDTKYVGSDKPREVGWFSQFHGFMSYRYQLERGLI